MVIAITFFSILVLGAAIRIFLWRRKKAHLIALDNDIAHFRIAAQSGSIPEINLYGQKLIWNEHLTPSILNEIADVVALHIANNPELQELNLNIYNRRLRFERINPDLWGIG